MLHFINAVEPEAWAGIAAVLVGMVGAVIAAVRGSRKTPVEVGHGTPETDRVEYVIAELRAHRRRLDTIEDRASEIDRRTELILLDTRVLIARG